MAAEEEGCVSGVLWTLRAASRLFAAMPPGLVVASTDSVLLLPPAGWIDFTDGAGAPAAGLVVAVPAPVALAASHGVCVPGGNGGAQLGRIAYRAGTEELEQMADHGGAVPVYTGLLWLSARAATALLELHARPPLDACTYLGIDSGAPPLALDLHVDILGCLGSAGVENAYLALPAAAASRAASARALLWAAAAAARASAAVYRARR